MGACCIVGEEYFAHGCIVHSEQEGINMIEPLYILMITILSIARSLYNNELCLWIWQCFHAGCITHINDNIKNYNYINQMAVMPQLNVTGCSVNGECLPYGETLYWPEKCSELNCLDEGFGATLHYESYMEGCNCCLYEVISLFIVSIMFPALIFICDHVCLTFKVSAIVALYITMYSSVLWWPFSPDGGWRTYL